MAGLGRKVFTAGDVLTASDLQSYAVDQSVMVFAGTAARSSAIATPSEGMVSVVTDTDELQYYNGTSWATGLPFGAWQTWAPTLSNTWANGNGVYTATYCQIGKTVHVQMLFTLGSTTTKGASPMTFSLPVAAVNSGQPLLSRMVLGATGYIGFGVIAGGGTANTIAMYCVGSASAFANQASVTTTQPATWATNDYISIQFSYQAA